jgi:hypothetical protein
MRIAENGVETCCLSRSLIDFGSPRSQPGAGSGGKHTAHGSWKGFNSASSAGCRVRIHTIGFPLSATATVILPVLSVWREFRGRSLLTHVLERIPQPKLDYPRLAGTCNLAENAR